MSNEQIHALLATMREELELDIQLSAHRGQHIRASQRLAQFEQLAEHLEQTAHPGPPVLPGPQ